MILSYWHHIIDILQIHFKNNTLHLVGNEDACERICSILWKASVHSVISFHFISFTDFEHLVSKFVGKSFVWFYALILPFYIDAECCFNQEHFNIENIYAHQTTNITIILSFCSWISMEMVLITIMFVWLNSWQILRISIEICFAFSQEIGTLSWNRKNWTVWSWKWINN